MTSFSGKVLSPQTEDDLTPAGEPVQKAIAGRTLRALAWSRLKKDKVALAGGIFVVVLMVTAVLAARSAACSASTRTRSTPT